MVVLVVEQVLLEQQQLRLQLSIQAVTVNNTVFLVHKYIMLAVALELHVSGRRGAHDLDTRPAELLLRGSDGYFPRARAPVTPPALTARR